MSKPDDCTLSPHELRRVRVEAKRALKESGALGVFPTPVAAIMKAAQVREVEDDILNEGFVARMRAKAGSALKSALSKVLGLLHASAGLVYIDRTLMVVKQTFIRLHEAGHGFLPWQRGLYAVVEDCKKTLESDVADLFDREANVFASEVLFQIDAFIEEANEQEFSIWTPVKMSRKYGASIYASVRQYVSKNHRACAVLVLDPPEILPGVGFRATLRRPIQSSRFTEIFGAIKWLEVYTPNDQIGAMVPINRKASGKRTIVLSDRNADRQECIAEAFTQKHQVFILIHATKTLTKTTIILPTIARA